MRSVLLSIKLKTLRLFQFWNIEEKLIRDGTLGNSLWFDFSSFILSWVRWGLIFLRIELTITVVSIGFCCNNCFSRTSFFMNETQSEMMMNIVKNKNNNADKETDNGTEKQGELKISGIFYVDENTWTVWIDGVAYSTIGQQKDFSIDSVTEDYITLTLNDGRTITMPVSIGVAEDSDPSEKAEK